ncbi:helix-turn-helix domain-containing protein [Actinoplanes sp. CA-054009]
MATVGDPGRVLAKRLRELRKAWWPDVSITQADLAEALAGRKKTSVQLVSSWERLADPTPPPEDRLNAILTFYCTRRSIESRPYKLVSEQELTADEAETRDTLARELFALREAPAAAWNGTTIVGHGPWFYDEGPVMIVCAEPDNGEPQADLDPDRSKLSRLADLDSLFELHGHIRAVNPDLEVQWASARDMKETDWTKHLVLLGGIDWNSATQDAMRLTPVPVTQLSDDADPSRGCFRVVTDGQAQSFTPEFVSRGDDRILVQDVGHFFRAANPLNLEKTITVCNGMYGKGVYGAVRALTHDVFRDKNAAFLADRFPGEEAFSLLFRVQVLNGVVTTPDWTAPDTVRHGWPEA